jgi:hypothetical protein
MDTKRVRTRQADIAILNRVLDSALQIKNIVVQTELMLCAMKGLSRLEDEALCKPQA